MRVHDKKVMHFVVLYTFLTSLSVHVDVAHEYYARINIRSHPRYNMYAAVLQCYFAPSLFVFVTFVLFVAHTVVSCSLLISSLLSDY